MKNPNKNALFTLLGMNAKANGSRYGRFQSTDKGRLPAPAAFREDFIRYWVTLQQPGVGLQRQSTGSLLAWGALPRHCSVTSRSELLEAHVGPTERPPGLLMQEPGPRASGFLLPMAAPSGRSSPAPRGHPYSPLQ